MTIEENWAEFAAATGLGVEGGEAVNAKAIYFAAFSRGWIAAIEHLKERRDPMVADMEALSATLEPSQDGRSTWVKWLRWGGVTPAAK